MQPLHPTSAFLGVAIGDALGVPFEFMERENLKNAPIANMCGYGTHNQPRGTWSDDTTMTLCLAESLLNGYDLQNIATLFVKWVSENYWTAHNEVFDVGVTTGNSLLQLEELLKNNEIETLAHLNTLEVNCAKRNNGNGSLMRTLPLLWYIKGKPINEQWQLVWQVSALTHRHIRAGMCCLIYLKLAEYLLFGHDKITAYQRMRKDIIKFWQVIQFSDSEQQHFSRFIDNDISDLITDNLRTSGYVIDTLEASLWCFLHYDNYHDTVVEIIRLGDDTDTCGVVVGGLAGLYYGLNGIPSHWISTLARSKDIIKLSWQFANIYHE